MIKPIEYVYHKKYLDGIISKTVTSEKRHSMFYDERHYSFPINFYNFDYFNIFHQLFDFGIRRNTINEVCNNLNIIVRIKNWWAPPFYYYYRS